MRVVAAILFVFGIPWALVAWIMVFGGPGAIIEEFQAGRISDALQLVLFWPIWAVHIGLGYYIWSRWFSITRGKGASTRRFWWMASGHHFVWIAFGVVAYFQNDPMPPIIFWYRPHRLLHLRLVCDCRWLRSRGRGCAILTVGRVYSMRCLPPPPLWPRPPGWPDRYRPQNGVLRLTNPAAEVLAGPGDAFLKMVSAH